jgi:hypothetical protein
MHGRARRISKLQQPHRRQVPLEPNDSPRSPSLQVGSIAFPTRRRARQAYQTDTFFPYMERLNRSVRWPVCKVGNDI